MLRSADVSSKTPLVFIHSWTTACKHTDSPLFPTTALFRSMKPPPRPRGSYIVSSCLLQA